MTRVGPLCVVRPANWRVDGKDRHGRSGVTSPARGGFLIEIARRMDGQRNEKKNATLTSALPMPRTSSDLIARCNGRP